MKKEKVKKLFQIKFYEYPDGILESVGKIKEGKGIPAEFKEKFQSKPNQKTTRGDCLNELCDYAFDAVMVYLAEKDEIEETPEAFNQQKYEDMFKKDQIGIGVRSPTGEPNRLKKVDQNDKPYKIGVGSEETPAKHAPYKIHVHEGKDELGIMEHMGGSGVGSEETPAKHAGERLVNEPVIPKTVEQEKQAYAKKKAIEKETSTTSPSVPTTSTKSTPKTGRKSK